MTMLGEKRRKLRKMEDGGRNVQTPDAYGNFDSNKETYKI